MAQKKLFANETADFVQKEVNIFLAKTNYRR